jgi:hypothetical protein
MKPTWESTRTGLWASVTGCLVAACSSQGVESPSPRQPLAETRAREVIAQAVHDSGARPRGRYTIKVKGGRELEVDIGVAQKKYGVAYVSGTERSLLGDAIPAHDVGSASLVILRDIGDRENAVLLLHDLGYVADEQLGTDREKTGFAAELKLARDVKDFLAKARGESWP